MNKNEFLATARPLAIETYNDLRGHYWLYGSLAVAGLAAGMQAGRKLYAHRAANEVRQEAERIATRHEIAMDEQITELQRTAEQIVIDAEADSSAA